MSTSNGNLSDTEVASRVEAAISQVEATGGKVEATMARIRASLPAANGAPIAPRPERLRVGDAYLFPEELYGNLHQARILAGHLGVDPRLGWRTPVIGPIWMRVRQRIHQEVRIYIDALTTHQNSLNTYLIRSLTQMVESLDNLGLRVLKRQHAEQAEAIAALQAEVKALRGRMEALEARLATAEGRG